MPRGILIGLVVLQLLIFPQVSAITDTCQTPVPLRQQFITEIDPQGTELFSINSTATNLNWELSIMWPHSLIYYLENYIKLQLNDDGSWSVILIGVLDVELFFSEKSINLADNPIGIELKCYDTTSQSWIVYSRQIVVYAVSEYMPIFTMPNISIRLPEAELKDTKVFDLNQFVIDKDIAQASKPDNRYFAINNIGNKPPDGTFLVTANGHIYVYYLTDYEKADRYFQMNISVMETKEHRSFITVNIEIYNINDNDPMFLYPQCIHGCVNSFYLATVSSCYKGDVNQFKYGPINALDADDDPIVYTIVHASPMSVIDNFIFDEQSGNMKIIEQLMLVQAEILSFVIQASNTRVLPTNNTDFALRSAYSMLYLAIDATGC